VNLCANFQIPGGGHGTVIGGGMPDIFCFFEEHKKSTGKQQ
jgi:hypothetical protein